LRLFILSFLPVPTAKKPQKTALISVSDKTGIVSFARKLKRLGYRILSTGGTAALLRDNKVASVEVNDITSCPEMLGGRVKTLQPEVFGGILSDRSAQHAKDLKAHGIENIDLVCVNLYPFAATIAQQKVTLKQAIEKIDIGGVSLLRAAAKNHQHVLVIADPADYDRAATALKSGKLDTLPRELAVKAFRQTAGYDALIANYLGSASAASQLSYHPQQAEAVPLRYGENPHQDAVLYREPDSSYAAVAQAEILHGKELSYNNLVDAEVAWNIVADFAAQPTASVIKHACPCGVATAKTIENALQKALDADKKSPFGGIIALNRPVSPAAARVIAGMFLEVVIAPSFDTAALRILKKKKNLRLLATGGIQRKPADVEIKKVGGGLLVQRRDDSLITQKKLKIATKKAPTAKQVKDLLFAANVCKHVKSNAIVLVKDGVTVGIGAGQTARVDAVEIAVAKAGTRASGAVMASDAFFPFADGLTAGTAAGIAAVIHPGGSIRDAEVERAADKANISMIYSGIRGFKH